MKVKDLRAMLEKVDGETLVGIESHNNVGYVRVIEKTEVKKLVINKNGYFFKGTSEEIFDSVFVIVMDDKI